MQSIKSIMTDILTLNNDEQNQQIHDLSNINQDYQDISNIRF